MKKINITYLIVFTFIFLTSFVVRNNQSELLSIIKLILDSSIVFFSISTIIFIVTLLHKWRFNELNLNELSDSKKYRNTLSEIISAITEPSTFICSVSILKGLILDYFYNDTYFVKFDQPEKIFLLIAAFYFFISSFLEIKENFFELILKTSEVETTKH